MSIIMAFFILGYWCQSVMCFFLRVESKLLELIYSNTQISTLRKRKYCVMRTKMGVEDGEGQ